MAIRKPRAKLRESIDFMTQRLCTGLLREPAVQRRARSRRSDRIWAVCERTGVVHDRETPAGFMVVARHAMIDRPTED